MSSNTSVTILGTYAGSTKSATLTVTSGREGWALKAVYFLRLSSFGL